MIINTGGTLSSVAKEYGLTPGLTTESMLRELHIVAGEAILTTLEYASVDSANIFPEDWAKLAQLISEKRDRFDGIVVIHGTDTLAYTCPSRTRWRMRWKTCGALFIWRRPDVPECSWPSTERSCSDAARQR